MTVEASKKIRGLLASAGYGKADVSVYNKGYSMGSTVYVTIKRAGIQLEKIEQIAKAGESVDRDASGAILGGGNCFVDVRYGDGVLDEQAARINAQVAAGRRSFGRFSLYDKDPFTWQVVESMGDGSGRSGMNLDRKEPGDGFARILASAGALSVLHDEENEPCPECGLFEAHEGICVGPVNTSDPILESNAQAAADALIEAANDVAREMFPIADIKASGEASDGSQERFARFISDAAMLSETDRQALFARINAAAAARGAPSAEEVADMIHGTLEPSLIASYFETPNLPGDIEIEGTVVTLTVAGGVYRISVERER